MEPIANTAAAQPAPLHSADGDEAVIQPSSTQPPSRTNHILLYSFLNLAVAGFFGCWLRGQKETAARQSNCPRRCGGTSDQPSNRTLICWCRSVFGTLGLSECCYIGPYRCTCSTDSCAVGQRPCRARWWRRTRARETCCCFVEGFGAC
jgi:hypothetical protein